MWVRVPPSLLMFKGKIMKEPVAIPHVGIVYRVIIRCRTGYYVRWCGTKVPVIQHEITRTWYLTCVGEVLGV